MVVGRCYRVPVRGRGGMAVRCRGRVSVRRRGRVSVRCWGRVAVRCRGCAAASGGAPGTQLSKRELAVLFIARSATANERGGR